MPVKILPSGRVTQVSRIATFDGDLERAAVGRSVTLAFADQIDASRGDVVVGVEATPAITERITARLFWMDCAALQPGRRYLLKLATTTVTATIETECMYSISMPECWFPVTRWRKTKSVWQHSSLSARSPSTCTQSAKTPVVSF
jgi:bifunctional enzyme CysN/CysC